MSDLISRECLNEYRSEDNSTPFFRGWNSAIEAIYVTAKSVNNNLCKDELTVQQAQNAIRCKDCKYVWAEDGWDNLYCNRVRCSGSFAVDRDGFCAWAEREEGK